MEIVKLTLGAYSEHTYLVMDGEFCCVIDPEKSDGRIQEILDEKGWKPDAILLTHTHLDHLAGAAELSAEIPIYVHENEESFVKGRNEGIGFPFEKDVELNNPVKARRDGDRVGCFRVVHTPGHSPGGCLYVTEGHVFSGDSMFVNGMPMMDFLLCDKDAYIDVSIPKMRKLDPYALLHAGHGTQGRVVEGIPAEGMIR